MMRRRNRRPFASMLLYTGSALALAMVVGCTDHPSAAAARTGADAWVGSIRDSAGVRIVSNPDRGTWSRADAWRVEEVLRIGVSDGPPELVFGRVGSVAAGIDGRIYVLDLQARTIRAFAPSGEYLFSIGRAGDGPGEIRAPTAVLVDATGMLFVPDPTAHRVTTFMPDGELAEVLPLRLPAGLTQRWGLTEGGGLVHQIDILAGGLAAGAISRVLHHHSGFTVTDTVLELPPSRAVVSDGGNLTFRPFQPAAMTRPLDGRRLAVALDSVYRVEIRDVSGRLDHIIEKSSTSQRVGPQDRDAYANRLTETFARDFGGSLQHVNWEFPRHFPVIADARSGPDESLWVQHSFRTGELTDPLLDVNARGSNRWDIFDADGRYLGIVELPRGFTLHAIRDDLVYGTAQGESDTPVVVVLRIVRPAVPA